MSDLDLDLDAIGRHISQADKVYGATLDCTETHDEDDLHEAGLLNALYCVISDARELLAEVERLRREQSVELANAEARADVLAEQVARLKDDIASLGHWDCPNCENCPGVDDEGMCKRCGNQAEWWEPDTITKVRAEVERLKANQLPDGGEWLRGDGGWIVNGEFQRWISGSFAAPTHRRRVWYGPVEPIGPVSDSEPRSDVDPADDTQTTP